MPINSPTAPSGSALAEIAASLSAQGQSGTTLADDFTVGMWCKTLPSPRAPLAFYFVQSLTKEFCFVLGIHPMCVFQPQFVLFLINFQHLTFFICLSVSCISFFLLLFFTLHFSVHQRWASVSLIDSPSFARWIKENCCFAVYTLQ